MSGMGRREFVSLFGGAAAGWPFAARAQQPERKRRIGVLFSMAEHDPAGPTYSVAFEEALRGLGWMQERNVRIDYRWAAGDPTLVRRYGQELVALKPDLLVIQTTIILAAVRQLNAIVPIVFVTGADPIDSGVVPSLANPGGNVTGFTSFEYTIGGKWIELLKEVAPSTTRVALISSAQSLTMPGWMRAVEVIASSLKVEITKAALPEISAIGPSIDNFAREPNGALIILPSVFTQVNRELIIACAAQNKVPAIYPFHYYVRSGGLMSYGFDVPDFFHRAASYADRILRGTKPAELPVQAPTKFELVINLPTAKALGLTVPPSLLGRADEVIE